MTAYDRWLEKPYQDACAKQEAIEEVVEELLQDECNPQNPSVFLEAINEGACLDNDFVHSRLAEILAKGHSYADIGELVYDAVVEYCESTANTRAESVIKFRNK
jgi:hypothetical protein